MIMLLHSTWDLYNTEMVYHYLLYAVYDLFKDSMYYFSDSKSCIINDFNLHFINLAISK